MGYRRSVRSITISVICSLIILLFLPSRQFAQQVSQQQGVKEHTRQLLQKLRQKYTEGDNGTAPSRRGKVNYNSLNDKYVQIDSDQKWLYAQNNNNKYNFGLFEKGSYAGDINGDGKADFIVKGTARDERTSDLTDNTAKTAVFYTEESKKAQKPDTVLYNNLVPVGDLNGDGHADAIEQEQDRQPVFYKGTSWGYQNTGMGLPMPSDPFSLHSFSDIDGDGFGDLIFTTEYYAYRFLVIYGGPKGDFQYHSYTFPDYREHQLSKFATTDVDDNGDDEIIELNNTQYSGSTNGLNVIDISNRAEAISMQKLDWQVPRPNAFPSYHLYATNIDGAGGAEIFVHSFYSSTDNFVFKHNASTSQYSTSPVTYDGFYVPAGDLNGDGRDDFIKADRPGGDGSQSAPFIAYGKADLSQPGNDVELSGDSNSQWYWGLDENQSYAMYGDLIGDEADDFILSHNEETTIGRRIIEGSNSGTITSHFVHYPRKNYFAQVDATKNVGDLNGDGFDDIAFQRSSSIEIYLGGESISSSPDFTVSLGFTPFGIDGGDFNGDGMNDLVISGNTGINVAILKGGENMDGTIDKSISSKDVLLQPSEGYRAFYNVNTVGDVNDDGSDDFILGSIFSSDQSGGTRSYYNEAYLFLGGDGSLPAEPGKTISLADKGTQYIGAGYKSASLGDINGDGIDDFAVSLIGMPSSDMEANGQLNVYYGGSGKDFASPDLKLTPPVDMVSSFSWSSTGADINGDGINDIAVSTAASGYDIPGLFVFYGGASADNKVDRQLVIKSDLLDTPNEGTSHAGHLKSLTDYNGNDRDEIMLTSGGSGSNAIIYEFNGPDQVNKMIVKGKNADAILGGRWDSAVGDFDNNGTNDMVLSQTNDNNDAYRSSRVYRYELPVPLTISKIEDRPDDQGGWVRIHLGGYLMDAAHKSYYGFNQLSVWQKVDEGSYTPLKTVQPYGESTGYIDVQVPDTTSFPHGSHNEYTFKATASKSIGTDPLVYLAETPDSVGQAIDNIAPDQVAGVNASRGNDQVQISWEASDDSDVAAYVVSNVNSNGEIESRVDTTTGTSVTLSDEDFEGVNNFAVRAFDNASNGSKLSHSNAAVFPVDVDFAISQGWNMIGMPLDTDGTEFKTLTDNIEAGNLYYYDGGYKQVKDVESIEKGVGYWGKFPSSDQYSLGGLPLTNLTVNLDKGWNLISGVGQAISADQIRDTDNIVIQGTLQGFDGGYTEASQLTAGQGYWIRADAAGSIELSLINDNTTTNARHRLAAKKKRKAIREVKDDFNKLIVRDSEDHERTLYFGNDLPEKVDERSFSLPPTPPGEAFDARFYQTDKTLTENDEMIVSLSRIGRTSLSLKFNVKTTYKYQAFEVREIKDGTELAKYVVNSDEPVQVKNSDTELLKMKPLALKGLAANEKPDKYKLYKNYPNPFNPSTTIRYSIPEASNVSLNVYNVLGEKVATLVDEQKAAGNYKVTFNASNLSSGMYFVKINAGSYQNVQKITLIK